VLSILVSQSCLLPLGRGQFEHSDLNPCLAKFAAVPRTHYVGALTSYAHPGVP
jgi:hypothetical protein